MTGWKRKGEWLEHPAGTQLDVPPKLLHKLRQHGGMMEKPGKVLLRLFPEEPLHCMPHYMQLEVLFEDDFCLIAYKPAGMKVHPTLPGETDTLDNAVAFHYESTGQVCKVRHIHRLDEDTTGPVLYAKNEWAQLLLDRDMREKSISRAYAAIVHGRLRKKKDTIDAPIGKDRHHASRRRVSPTGEPAVTHYEVAEQYQDAAIVRLRLSTGRTHQIRVHMSYLGHPLLGDELYGGKPLGIQRQALHGESLSFSHPFTQELIIVEAPWPDDMAQLASNLQKL
ncbi:RluA family pseudouridine synthase [Paenibacillus thalictri]|uniref:Pseudouridine synthase n=1 Tax=Paenibacillus thalictri TaxID=2527873 RepID=A0A4Q9DYW1_9BACL|nr:RluA family pseudouridine synthase [Paenibacillus thalictri]TBL81645.1 RluA family pseudouridine synthase [Paenibacillus thalictri]